MSTVPTKTTWTNTDDDAMREGAAVNFLRNISAVRRRRRAVTISKKGKHQ